MQALEFHDPSICLNTFHRPNLSFQVRHSFTNTLATLEEDLFPFLNSQDAAPSMQGAAPPASG
ncbi:hypothetical protein T484DRAFT_1858596 [Baffinella frigidus]|nr:hypothetical protein T484DRAFT_1858596 [Cryptophyta sp. CCMP2293]